MSNFLKSPPSFPVKKLKPCSMSESGTFEKSNFQNLTRSKPILLMACEYHTTRFFGIKLCQYKLTLSITEEPERQKKPLISESSTKDLPIFFATFRIDFFVFFDQKINRKRFMKVLLRINDFSFLFFF